MKPFDLTAKGFVEITPGVFERQPVPAIRLLMPAQHAAREKDLHAGILDYCRARGWPVVHSRMDVPQTAGIGTPDFVIAMPGGKTVWIEAKAAAGKLRPEQLAWIASLRRLGHAAYVVRSMEDFSAAISEQQRVPA